MTPRHVALLTSALAVLVWVPSLLHANAATTTPAPAVATTTAAAGAPFTRSARREGVGLVTAIEVAGPYAYVTVRSDDGVTGVTATIGTDAVVGDRVRLTLFGRRDRFESRRLGKTFSPLDFGVVSHLKGSPAR